MKMLLTRDTPLDVFKKRGNVIIHMFYEVKSGGGVWMGDREKA